MEGEPTHARILAEIAELKGEVKGLREDVASTRELVEAWDAIKTGSRALTWLAKLAAACLALWAMFKIGAAGIVDIGSKP